MRLSTICASCKERTSVRSNASDRPELIKDKGETFNLQCEHCQKNHTVHVNDVRAQPDPKVMALGVLVSLVVTVILWMILGAVGTVSIAIPIIIWAQQNKAVHNFNRYLTRR